MLQHFQKKMCAVLLSKVSKVDKAWPEGFIINHYSRLPLCCVVCVVGIVKLKS